jgi:hypothetical protein
MVLPAHALQTEQNGLKSVSNERQFTPEAKSVFRTYLPYDCGQVS